MAYTKLSEIIAATGLSTNSFAYVIDNRPGKGTSRDYFTLNPSLDPNKMSSWANWSYVATAKVIILDNTLATITPSPGTYNYNIGTNLSLSCVLKDTSGRYVFNGWYANGSLISTGQYPQYVVNGDVTLSVSISDTYTRYYTEPLFAAGTTNFCINSSPTGVVTEYYTSDPDGLYLYTWPTIDTASTGLGGMYWRIKGVDTDIEYANGPISQEDLAWNMSYRIEGWTSDTGWRAEVYNAEGYVLFSQDINSIDTSIE